MSDIYYSEDSVGRPRADISKFGKRKHAKSEALKKKKNHKTPEDWRKGKAKAGEVRWDMSHHRKIGGELD